MDNFVRELIFWLQMHASAEVLTIGTFLICVGSILLFLRFSGDTGLYVYNALALVSRIFKYFV